MTTTDTSPAYAESPPGDVGFAARGVVGDSGRGRMGRRGAGAAVGTAVRMALAASLVLGLTAVPPAVAAGSPTAESSGIAGESLEPRTKDPRAYLIRTTHLPVDGSDTMIVTEARAGRPTPIDVDASGSADIVVTLSANPREPGIQVARTAGADGALPLVVEVLTAPRGWASGDRVAFTFDARSTGTPARMAVSTSAPGVVFQAASAITRLAVEVLGSRSLTVDVSDAPVRFALERRDNRISYVASSRPSNVSVRAAGPDAFGRATDLQLTLRTASTQFDLALPAHGTVDIDAHGERIGLIELLATSGPTDALPEGFDGILLQDLASDFLLRASLNEVERAVVGHGLGSRVELATAGGRPFKTGVFLAAPEKPGRRPGEDYTTVTLLSLPSRVRFDIERLDPGNVEFVYDASSTANSMHFETNAGDRWVTELVAANPLPPRLRICSAPDERCGGSGRVGAGSLGSFRVEGSHRSQVRFFDCVRPLDERCNAPSGSPEEGLFADLEARALVFDGAAVNCCAGGLQTRGHLFISTLPLESADTIRFSWVERWSPSDSVRLSLPSGFRADDRLAVFDRYPFIPFSDSQVERTGTITCPSGTTMPISLRREGSPAVNLHGTSLLC